MNLFSKEKDLIHRIANLILILWVVIALFVGYSSFINLVVKRDMLNYKEYEDQYCVDGVSNEKTSSGSLDKAYSGNCKSAYERYQITFDDTDFYARKTLINSIGNVVIVGITIFLLNKKKRN